MTLLQALLQCPRGRAPCRCLLVVVVTNGAGEFTRFLAAEEAVEGLEAA